MAIINTGTKRCENCIGLGRLLVKHAVMSEWEGIKGIFMTREQLQPEKREDCKECNGHGYLVKQDHIEYANRPPTDPSELKYMKLPTREKNWFMRWLGVSNPALDITNRKN